MKNKNSIYLGVLIVFLLAGFFLINGNSTPPGDFTAAKEIQYVKIGEAKIKVELAKTPEAQQQGLSGRSELKNNEGMLFIFEQPDQYNFWMKDMNFAIDIIWFGANGEVVYIKKDARPESYPETFGPAKDAVYVLEVVSGFSQKNNLKIGDKAEFIY